MTNIKIAQSMKGNNFFFFLENIETVYLFIFFFFKMLKVIYIY